MFINVAIAFVSRVYVTKSNGDDGFTKKVMTDGYFLT